MKKRGISLIVLIITIIIVIILAAVVVLTISKNNPIESAKEATFKEDLRAVQDQVEMYIASKYQKELNDFDKNTLNISGETLVSDFGMPVKYIDKIAVEEGKVTYNGDNEKEIKWAKDLKITINKKKVSKIIGEIYTTSTNGADARIKVVSYTDNIEKEISHRDSTEEFTDFNVSYNRMEYKWHIKSDNNYFAFSTTSTTDFTQFVLSTDINWGYLENVHYYIALVEGSGFYKITYDMNGSTSSYLPLFYNTNVETELPIPVRREDKFLGWKDSNDATSQLIMKIPKYSKGDKHLVATFEHVGDFNIDTTSTRAINASIEVRGYNPYFTNEIIHREAMNTVKEFTNFSISYGNLKWTLKALSDNVYYATSRDTPISEYQKLDSLSWSYTTEVHYYIIIK